MKIKHKNSMIIKNYKKNLGESFKLSKKKVLVGLTTKIDTSKYKRRSNTLKFES